MAYRPDAKFDRVRLARNKAVNKDGRLIRPDYVLAKSAPDGALEHNQSYQDASPSIYFFLIATVLHHLFVALIRTALFTLQIGRQG